MRQSKATRKAPKAPGLIFVVDDEALLGEYAGAVLQEEGYKIQYFTDPREVLKAMQVADPKPVALVTDYEMGKMTGLELIISSHKIHPKLKTVLTSGSVDAEVAAKHSREVHKFLGKPYLPAQLTAMVGELLQRRS
jgi:two-component system cell cycle sensor histidine kinase/response regulator CckA